MGLFSNQKDDSKKAKQRAAKYRDYIRKEAVLGGTVFGPVQRGVRREFFCLDERTWVWHEEWTDHLGKRHIQTTRYDIRPDGVVKCQNDGPYIKVSPEEIRNLYQATLRYRDLVHKEIYSKIEDTNYKASRQDYTFAA